MFVRNCPGQIGGRKSSDYAAAARPRSQRRAAIVAAVQVNMGASAAIRCRKQKEALPRRERLVSDLNHDLR